MNYIRCCKSRSFSLLCICALILSIDKKICVAIFVKICLTRFVCSQNKKLYVRVIQARLSWLFSLQKIIQTNHQQCGLFLECFILIVSWKKLLWHYHLFHEKHFSSCQFSLKTMNYLSNLSVYADGSICLDILQNQWSPIYDVAAILTSIQVLLIVLLVWVRHCHFFYVYAWIKQSRNAWLKIFITCCNHMDKPSKV